MKRAALVPNVRHCPCGELIVLRPGAREARQWCSDCVAFVDAVLSAESNPAVLRLPAGKSLDGFLKELETELVERAMAIHGTRRAAAAALGIPMNTLKGKLRRGKRREQEVSP